MSDIRIASQTANRSNFGNLSLTPPETSPGQTEPDAEGYIAFAQEALKALVKGISALVPEAHAAEAPPSQNIAFSHQGRLLDGNDAPVNGAHQMTFKLYSFPVKHPNEQSLWEQDYPIQVVNGVYAVTLGDTDESRKPLPTSLFPSGEERYLTVAIDGEAEMEPRLRIGLLPYAAVAIKAGLADKASLADEATHAVTADSATNATNAANSADSAKLGGELPDFYRDASNLNAGTLVSDRLSGEYAGQFNFSNALNTYAGDGSGLTNVHAVTADSATNATNATNSADSAKLGNQLPDFYRDASNLNAGTLSSDRLSGTYSQQLTFNNTLNTYLGDGSGLTGLSGTDATKVLKAGDTMTGTLNLTTAATSITTEGNVGIGTTAPTAKLHAVTSDTATNAISRVARFDHALSSGTATNGIGAEIVLRAPNSSGDLLTAAGIATIVTDVTNNNTDLTFSVMRLSEGGQERLRIQSDGNVGIGTTSPEELLHLNKDSADVYIRVQADNAQTSGLSLASDGHSGAVQFRRMPTSGNLEVHVPSGSPRMTIDTSGNVGIGTTAPASALHVSGAVQLGNDSAACSSTKVGALRWEPTWGLQVCQVNKDKAGLVGYAWAVARSRPVIWSGGCNYQSRGSGWDTYCANGEDFNNISDYLGVNTNGNFTVKISGYYRINMWADQHGCGHKRVNFVHNDTSRAYSHHYESTYAWDLNINDLVWPMRKDDTFYLQLHHDGGCDPYRWHSWNVNGHHSRLQVEYLGPLE